MISYGTIIDWIIENRKGFAFRGYTKDLIYKEILEAIDNNVFRVWFGEDGKIEGVVCGKKQEGKVIYIYDVLTTKAGVIKEFMKIFMTMYPDYIIKGCAKGFSKDGKAGRERVFYSPKKVIQRL